MHKLAIGLAALSAVVISAAPAAANELCLMLKLC
jgi:hypothetical protein